MSVPTLHCDALSCVHNFYERCGATHINVSGGSTTRARKTNCESYNKDTISYLNRSSDFDFYNTPDRAKLEAEIADMDTDRDAPNIACDATNCIYNNNMLCHARTVKIKAPHDKKCSCATFKIG